MDPTIKPWVQETGVEVLDQPFYASGNMATVGECSAPPYLVAWAIACTEGIEAATEAVHYAAPADEKEAYVKNALRNLRLHLPG